MIYCKDHERGIYIDFNQCPWFVDHGFEHAKGVLSNLDGILLPKFKENKEFLNAWELFYLMCAALLHDIGMCYREEIKDKYSERSIEIRKKHGLYSAEMIMEEKGIPLNSDERRIIADIAKYHQSKAPLTEKQAKEFGDKKIIDKFVEEYTTNEKREYIRLRFLAALLQLADACDINYRRAEKERYDKKLKNNRVKIREIKDDFTAITKPVVGSDKIKELEKEENPDNILKLCSEFLSNLKHLEEDKRYKGAYNFLKKLSVRIEILNIQKEHYPKHQAIEYAYFLREYIALKPYGDKNEKELEKAKEELRDELGLVGEVLYKIPSSPRFKEVLVVGDETWRREGLQEVEDARMLYERKAVPIREEKEEPELSIRIFSIDNNTKIARHRKFLEDFMREFISKKLEEHYKGEWWKERVPSGVQKKCADRKKERIKEGIATERYPLIGFADIPDYLEIFLFKSNWKDVFGKYYGESKEAKYVIKNKFSKLYPIRTDEAHSREISDEDVKNFEVNALDLLCIDKYKSEFRKLITSFEEATRKRIDYLSKIIHELKCERLDKSLVLSASKEEIFGFYSGNPPSWGIIAAGGDVRRDREKEIEQALQERNGFRIVCIVAEPGAGKTTAAWRAAYQLFQQGEIVLRLTDNSDSQFWYRVSELTEYIDRPFYILIDDLFRYKDFVLALQSINKDVLPVTIIATSRSSEYQEARGLSGFIKKIELKLSDIEKNELLKRLGKSYEAFSLDEQHIFDKTTFFLALGMVLTKGKGFHEIVRDIVDKLKEKDEILYRAYEYVCFSYNYYTSIPEDLLANLDEKGRFYRLLEKEAAKGIFYDVFVYSHPPKYIKAGHQLIAKEALLFYSRHPKVLFKEILEATNEENLLHRRFIARLTQVISQEEKEQNLREIRDFIVKSKKIADILRYATISELGIWRLIYKQLNLQKEAEKCTEEILLRVPNDTQDCRLLVIEHLSRGLEREAIFIMKSWLTEHSKDNVIFAQYLSLTMEKGTQEQI
ncbi:HD domain-containing protein, partial [candidate division WOR-3 bacterium]|nr:HD domain-containing protein [candidate division WOR-3 bacterium]